MSEIDPWPLFFIISSTNSCENRLTIVCEQAMPDQESEKNDSYSVEDDAQGDLSDQTPDRNSPKVQPGDDVKPLDLVDLPTESSTQESQASEDPDSDKEEQSHVKGLDVCPNCGSTMRDSGMLVCMRCGFDLKTLKVLKTTTGEITEEELEEDDEEEVKIPLSLPGRGDLKVPLIVLAACAILITIGYLVGADGLFSLKDQNGASITPDAGERFAAWGFYLALLILGTGCGLIGLFTVSKLNEVPFGDLKLASSRMAAITATMWLVKYLSLGKGFFENAVEWILHAGIFVGLSMLFFKLIPRDAAIAGIASLIVAFIFWLIATILT